jgi:hypothetical protein
VCPCCKGSQASRQRLKERKSTRTFDVEIVIRMAPRVLSLGKDLLPIVPFSRCPGWQKVELSLCQQGTCFQRCGRPESCLHPQWGGFPFFLVVFFLHHAPDVPGGMAKLTAGHASTQVEIADTYRIILELVRKVILALGHGTDEHADALVWPEALDVVPDSHHRRVVAERHLSTVGWQMVRDGILDDVDQLFLRRRRPNRQPVKQLHHQSSEALERSRNPNRRAHFDQHVLLRVDVDLQLAGLVDGRVKQGEQTLKRPVARKRSACCVAQGSLGKPLTW